ncbi:hypothetical protein ILUMI_07016, partial [Ignelater luminosus]
ATSEPISIRDRILQAMNQCIQENAWDENELKEIFKNNFLLPTDNEKVNDFLLCYWKKLNMIDQHGEINLSQVKVLIPNLIRELFHNISENESVILADQAVNECNKRGVATGKSMGQNCVLLRNCVAQYVKDKQD